MEATPPRIDPKYAIYMRLGALAIAYGAYRAVEDERLSSGIFIGFGVLLLGYSLVTYLTTRRDQRSGLMQAGQTILGIGLVGLGLIQLVT
ncbi:MAG: hypothetical protein QOG04_1177 [Actinomycetota bacterium]|jgi:hypothetical protein|nr:hypothetical protein [Actinomycetota bacterium]